MKIVCVNNKPKIWKDEIVKEFAPITIGNTYDALIYSFDNEYWLVNDNNEFTWENKTNFILLDECRDNKINEVLR